MRLPKRVVFVADRQLDHSAASLERADLELAGHEFDELLAALRRTCADVVCYASPAQFADKAHTHNDDVVLSIWSGFHSRSRRSIVPSICEAFGIAYIGPDAYVSAIGQDKWLCKLMASAFGFETPRAVLIQAVGEIESGLNTVRCPLVIKPNFEGGSIGISSKCLVSDPVAASQMVMTLLRVHQQPILVKEFVRGKEVSFVLMGKRQSLDICEVLELRLRDQDLYDTILSLELKHVPLDFWWDDVTDAISPRDIERGRRWFRALGKVEVIRIDGRLSDDGRFSFIELSPGCQSGKRWIGWRSICPWRLYIRRLRSPPRRECSGAQRWLGARAGIAP